LLRAEKKHGRNFTHFPLMVIFSSHRLIVKFAGFMVVFRLKNEHATNIEEIAVCGWLFLAKSDQKGSPLWGIQIFLESELQYRS